MKRYVLALLLAFNGVTALLGGIGLMTGVLAPPESWLTGTSFSSYVVPGLILSLIVGGSALLAYFSYRELRYIAWEISAASGLILAGWIVGEIVVLGHYSMLQPLYLLSGVLVVLFSVQTRQTIQRG